MRTVNRSRAVLLLCSSSILVVSLFAACFDSIRTGPGDRPYRVVRRHYTVPGIGNLMFEVPVGWNETVEPAKEGHPYTIRYQTPSDEVILMLWPRPPHSTPESDKQWIKNMMKYRCGYGLELRGPGGPSWPRSIPSDVIHGYQCITIDAQSTVDEYEVTEGVGVRDGIGIIFSFRSQDTPITIETRGLAMLETFEVRSRDHRE
jgi:hypothetical protein